jgi:hypothetical protein
MFGTQERDCGALIGSVSASARKSSLGMGIFGIHLTSTKPRQILPPCMPEKEETGRYRYRGRFEAAVTTTVLIDETDKDALQKYINGILGVGETKAEEGKA